jgi:hypothetical protein
MLNSTDSADEQATRPEQAAYPLPERDSAASESAPIAEAGPHGTDVFLFGGVERNFAGVVGEAIDVLGFNTQDGPYVGLIRAGGFELGDGFDLGAVSGKETLLGSYGVTDTTINLEYGSLQAELPLIGGGGVGYGEYSMTTGETGSFLFGTVHILGFGAEFGFGWSGETFEPNAY